ncbi:RDD family protein [Streptomyces lunaelactis]|uniref:RDD family protein n=1 Tax=Streptomyces lunaelactis TaxID=1535768 RepID=UPI0015855C7B|nr:RDD family protein [Streptomyces lunaelactis]NUK03546.1 RDD family protein [Streptomyces lunaelactis]NUK10564.1 RDD family protein [Streptomyces lunaelactis]NUK19182.1 RDD family protein [Streptomyces lunaelactis]NUK26567.1 RDD family protein [Streptomyces lunaelactis]NUK37904.1 RDD family protein [Streptomyces lunaelactis]
MSNEPPPPGEPPENDPFRKQPPDSTPPSDGPQQPPQGPPQDDPYGSGRSGSPYGSGQGGGSPYDGGGQPPPYDAGGSGGPYGGADPLAGMPPLADFGKRFLARVIDALIIFVPLLLISLLAGGWDVTTDDGDDWDSFTNQVNTGRQWLWSLISLVAYVGYDTIMTARNGQSVGKRLMKIRVAMLNDGSVPDSSSSLLRAVVLWVPALVCCFCLWWIVIIITILVDKPYKQGLHDKAGKTVVVSAAQ